MNNIFCTLFDVNYLDKGIVLYKSLERVCQTFKLYVFCFDDKTYEVLNQLSFKNMILVSKHDFEDEILLNLKKQRSPAEYCWTCTPITIEYVLKKYNEHICTYIDADMLFYDDPSILIDEMLLNNGSILIVEHRFPKRKEKQLNSIHGRYCVEFNTFLNNSQGLECLDWWKASCIKECKYSKDPKENVGDQKYLESFEKKFSGVHVLEHIGGGVAPWNFKNYLFSEQNGSIFIKEKSGEWKSLVFCHFQNIRYISRRLVNIKSNTSNRFIRNNIYIPYLKEIEIVRSMLLSRYNIGFSIKKSYYKNPIKRFIQNYIMPFKIWPLSDLVSLRRIRKHENDSLQ